MPEPIHTRDLRLYICDGHRPAHDSAPYASGIALTQREYHALTSRISKYLNECRKRRIREGRDQGIQRAATALRDLLRNENWLTAVGVSSQNDGELIVYVDKSADRHAKSSDAIPARWWGFPVLVREMAKPKSFLEALVRMEDSEGPLVKSVTVRR